MKFPKYDTVYELVVKMNDLTLHEEDFLFYSFYLAEEAKKEFLSRGYTLVRFHTRNIYKDLPFVY